MWSSQLFVFVHNFDFVFSGLTLQQQRQQQMVLGNDQQLIAWKHIFLSEKLAEKEWEQRGKETWPSSKKIEFEKKQVRKRPFSTVTQHKENYGCVIITS